MNCKPGDLAYIVDGENAGHIVEVLQVDLIWSQIEKLPYWEVRSFVPLSCSDAWGRPRMATECSLEDSRLRPISGVPVDDEEPAVVNMPEAFQLALGIEMRAWV
ncbi:hypothetical protein [Caballeronia sp. LZ043]|uniref:hypothetical protein n=1 Tax=Caballeronia sp. LZ043 TaxID=3038569 RepID=UPI00286667C6|nr:hypothetical protein [Caballeronia sp. LZ043]MDR5825810.1 hypothetical protein [Caballeronia sp. LZ043]